MAKTVFLSGTLMTDVIGNSTKEYYTWDPTYHRASSAVKGSYLLFTSIFIADLMRTLSPSYCLGCFIETLTQKNTSNAFVSSTKKNRPGF